jgi:phosphoribosylformylglycinamidine synthase subunit PurSL
LKKTFRVEVRWRGQVDGRVQDLLAHIRHLDVRGVEDVDIINLYFLRGTLTRAEATRIATELLTDPVVESFQVRSLNESPPGGEPEAAQMRSSGPNRGAERDTQIVEVTYHPGVTDPVATHLLNRAKLLGVEGLEAAATGTRYAFSGSLTPPTLHTIAAELLCNTVIQSYTLGALEPAFVPEAAPSNRVETIAIRGLDDSALLNLSRDRVLFLSLQEMQAIQAHYQALNRDPTDVELETLAQTWSEHCLHKTFKADIAYDCRGGMPRRLPSGDAEQTAYGETIPGLLQTYLRAATERLNKPWVLSAFVDNAGIVAFDDAHVLAFKAETHNHPSALEPFGGANTGVGGVIRDVIGVSARPIANTDVLCFAPLDMAEDEIPEGSLSPRRTARGVVAGIEDYSNKMGIPTVSGAVLYDKDYVANPLVYCGCVGIARKGQHRTAPQPGDCIVTLGGRTGRDGLHGATFSSAELTHDTGQTVGSVVQIGDPITEKAVLDAVMQARDESLYTAITDCGAGGFSSAVGEIGEKTGVDVNLEDVPLKYPGLRPWEIWLSEAQERMVLAVPEVNLPRLGAICAIYDVEWTVIGRFTDDRRLRVRVGDQPVADLAMDFVHDGWPKPKLRAVWSPPEPDTESPAQDDEPVAILLSMLAHPDVASKAEVIRRYDHEVQAATVIKPLVGARNDGPSDAAVLHPLMVEGPEGLALSCGINPHYGRRDPYAMAWAVIDEAIRNLVCVGADPDRVSLLDNFCWGNPALPDRLGGLVRAAQGCHDAALAYGAPFISGKDSLNNEFVDADGRTRTIPPTLLISGLGHVPDVHRTVTMDFKRAGDLIYLAGATRREFGGSLFNRLHHRNDGSVPAPVPDAVATMRALHRAIRNDHVRAMHDLSEGGLAVAATEMCIAGRLGMELSLSDVARDPDADSDAALLFAESAGRFLIEVAPEDRAAFEATVDGLPIACVGTVTPTSELKIQGLKEEPVLTATVAALRTAWQSADIV